MESMMELKGMFPDVDDEVLKSVLESNGGDIPKSVDALLQISDPNYVPSQTLSNRILFTFTFFFF